MSHEYSQSLTASPASFEATRHLNAERAPIDQARRNRADMNDIGLVWGVFDVDTDTSSDESKAILRHQERFAQELAQSKVHAIQPQQRTYRHFVPGD